MKKIITSSCGKYNATVEVEVIVNKTNSNILEVNIVSDLFGQKINDEGMFFSKQKENLISFVQQVESDVKKKLDMLVEKQTLKYRDEIIKSLSKLNYV